MDLRFTNNGALPDAIRAGNLEEVNRQLRITNTINPIIGDIALANGGKRDTPVTGKVFKKHFYSPYFNYKYLPNNLKRRAYMKG